MSEYGKVYELIGETFRNMRKLDIANETRYTLSVADIEILKMLYKQNETIASLTKHLEYDKAFISRRVQVLEQASYVEKKPLNLKSNTIIITRSGIKKLSHIQKRIDETYQKLLSPEQLYTLLEITEQLNEKICLELALPDNVAEEKR